MTKSTRNQRSREAAGDRLEQEPIRGGGFADKIGRRVMEAAADTAAERCFTDQTMAVEVRYSWAQPVPLGPDFSVRPANTQCFSGSSSTSFTDTNFPFGSNVKT